ncbi:unnamed protein product, partial [Callosobruchus maculatus]
PSTAEEDAASSSTTRTTPELVSTAAAGLLPRRTGYHGTITLAVWYRGQLSRAPTALLRQEYRLSLSTVGDATHGRLLLLTTRSRILTHPYPGVTPFHQWPADSLWIFTVQFGAMGILPATVVLCFLVATCLAIDEHRPQRKEKRQLGYQISHHYASLPSSYRLERRISTGPQYHPHHPPPYYPRPYHKDYPHSNDLLTDGNNHLEQHHHHSGYGPPKPHIIERPVYIKEPEPIIEIIIKESNVSLPAPPPPPPPPKKKKEQVQVFYVKYQKNPNGKGKDAIIYDKPVPAISPKLPEDEEEEVEEAPYNYHTDLATAPPPPSTTLRTIIKPDSEVYHSPSGVKVTFGKEGFDYDKRSSKPEDYVPTYQKQQPQQQQPQGRQLTSFSNAYFKRPSSSQGFQSPSFGSNPRQPQAYRPITFPNSNFKTFGRQQYQQQSPFQQPPQFSRPSQPFNSFGSQGLTSPHFSHSISHPPPPRFQNSRPPPAPPAIPPRQPVPYTPFDKIRPQQPFPQPSPLSSHQSPPHQHQPIQFRPESHFPIYQQLPLAQQNYVFNKPPRFSQVLQTVKEERVPPQPIVQQQLPLEHEHHDQFSQTPEFQQHHQPPQQHDQQSAQPQFSTSHQQPPQHHEQQPAQPQFSSHQQGFQQHQNQQKPPQQYNHQQSQSHQSQPQHNFVQHNFNTERPQIQQQPVNNQLSQNDHLNILPPGGQLIQSVPKYEQHFSTVEPSAASNTKYQQKAIQNFNSQENLQSFTSNEQVSSNELLQQQKAFERQKELLEQRKQQQHKLLEEQRKRLQEEQLKQYLEQQQQQESRNPAPPPNGYFQSTRKEFVSSTPGIRYQSTTSNPSTTSTTTEAPTPSTTTKDPKILEAQLPDEVPEELRAQLLSSGILNNADISVLDYDKVGDIPLSALPPDQLANFFNAGGAAQIGAGSEPVAARLQVDGSEVRKSDDQESEEEEGAASEIEEVKMDAPTKKEAVDLKVVRYDPESSEGKEVQEAYVADTAGTVNPVVLNDNSYSRYLPLKVNGTQFPIPDVPELRGKRISSVVVLAPVSYDFSPSRQARSTKEEEKGENQTPKGPGDIDLIHDATLKKLIVEPTLENYRRFLESQNKTKNDQQSVILLVADPPDPASTEKEIFMYDVATQTVSKLSGELSSAFVEAAEANSAPSGDGQVAASSMIETKVPFPQQDWSESGTNILERRMSVQDDMDTDTTDQLEKTVEASDSDKTGQ